VNERQCPVQDFSLGDQDGQRSCCRCSATYPERSNLTPSMLHGCNFTVLAPLGIFPMGFARGTIMLQGCSEWPSSAPLAENSAPAHSCRKVFPSVALSRHLLQQLLKQTPLHCHSIVTKLRARGQDPTHCSVIFSSFLRLDC